jgi:translation initiation factor 2 alpha subunit (eIF-2alpha)
MNKIDTYNDLSLLTKWINNQKAFERHKRKLDEIYQNLHKNSYNEFGFKNKAFNEMQQKIKNIYEIHKFNDKGKLSI